MKLALEWVVNGEIIGVWPIFSGACPGFIDVSDEAEEPESESANRHPSP